MNHACPKGDKPVINTAFQQIESALYTIKAMA